MKDNIGNSALILLSWGIGILLCLTAWYFFILYARDLWVYAGNL